MQVKIIRTINGRSLSNIRYKNYFSVKTKDILYVLQDAAIPISCSELAHMFRTHPGLVSSILVNLERKGLIKAFGYGAYADITPKEQRYRRRLYKPGRPFKLFKTVTQPVTENIEDHYQYTDIDLDELPSKDLTSIDIRLKQLDSNFFIILTFLSKLERQCILHYYFLGSKLIEMAKLFHISIQEVQNILSKARTKIKNKINKLLKCTNIEESTEEKRFRFIVDTLGIKLRNRWSAYNFVLECYKPNKDDFYKELRKVSTRLYLRGNYRPQYTHIEKLITKQGLKLEENKHYGGLCLYIVILKEPRDFSWLRLDILENNLAANLDTIFYIPMTSLLGKGGYTHIEILRLNIIISDIKKGGGFICENLEDLPKVIKEVNKKYIRKVEKNLGKLKYCRLCGLLN